MHKTTFFEREKSAPAAFLRTFYRAGMNWKPVCIVLEPAQERCLERINLTISANLIRFIWQRRIGNRSEWAQNVAKTACFFNKTLSRNGMFKPAWYGGNSLESNVSGWKWSQNSLGLDDKSRRKCHVLTRFIWQELTRNWCL